MRARAVSRFPALSPPQWLALLAAVIFAIMYFSTALPRLVYPYDLDFIEDSMLMQALRFARQQPVFIAPNADFNPHVYMPFYTFLGGWLFKFTSPSFVPLRLLSFSASLVMALLVGYITFRETKGDKWLLCVSVGLALGGYRISGFWFDLARVDSLFVALGLSGFTLGLYARDSQTGVVTSALLLALAFFTKQTALLLSLGLAVCLFLTNRRNGWLFTITYVGLISVSLFSINSFTDGWFFYHVFGIASRDPVELQRLGQYIVGEVFGRMVGLSLPALLAAGLGFRRVGWRILREQPWLVGLAMAVAISGAGRISVGGNLNNLMPAYACLCLAPALLCRELKLWAAKPIPASRPRLGWPRIYSPEIIIPLLALLQFALGVYNPFRYIPSPAMRASGDRFIQRLASINGNVLVMMHPYYALLAGKEPATQIAALWYVRERGALPLPDDFVSRLQNHYYAAIISDESFFEIEPTLVGLITKYYVLAETLPLASTPLAPVGMAVRPQVIYLPAQP
jgi:hypothetical protein